jgi:hypothetical protein
VGTCQFRHGVHTLPLLLAVLLLGAHTAAAAGTVKWTVLVYLLADNDLECFGIYNMQDMMQGMFQEPPVGCITTACGSKCSNTTSVTSSSACADGSIKSRCCPTDAYPDVLLLVDKGVSVCSYARPAPFDYSLFDSTWTTAKELLLLPGGTFQQIRDYGEIDMSAPDTLAGFLKRALVRFPPDSTRK